MLLRSLTSFRYSAFKRAPAPTATVAFFWSTPSTPLASTRPSLQQQQQQLNMLSGNETPAPAGQVCEDGVCYIDFSKRKQAQSSTSTSTIASQVDSALTSTPVMVYSKTYCPYCDKAKELLSHKGVKYTSVELDSVTDGEKMHAYLKEKTGQTSVPNIFIGGKHIGGCSDLLELEQKGELDTLLKSLL